MSIDQFIEDSNVEYTKNLIGSEDVSSYEKEVGVSFGKELIHYLLTYGYLAYKYVELYGINSIQMGSSDMVDMTKYLHNYFPTTAEYIALESIGDGDYILISPDDDVCKFISESKEIKDLNLKLFDYILKRFKEADQYTK